MEQRNLFQSFGCAAKGLIHTFKTQRNFRIHVIIATGAILLGLMLKISAVEMAIVVLTIMFVMVCELINTALESSLDFINGKKIHPYVKLIKDVVAAGVLLASINALIVGAIIFLRHL